MDPNIFPRAWKPFFVWAEASGLGTMVRDSIWQFAAVEAVHLLALAVIGGAVLIVDLRLLGLTLQRQSVSPSRARPLHGCSGSHDHDARDRMGADGPRWRLRSTT
jgi:hypothetical protein